MAGGSGTRNNLANTKKNENVEPAPKADNASVR